MRSRLLTLIAMYLPFAAVLALVGYAFTWKIPLAFALLIGFLLLRLRSNPSRRAAGRARTIIELFACAFLVAVFAGVLFGGVGTLIGFAVGFSLRLGEIPITFPKSWQSSGDRARPKK
jgi:hypothetical protein